MIVEARHNLGSKTLCRPSTAPDPGDRRRFLALYICILSRVSGESLSPPWAQPGVTPTRSPQLDLSNIAQATAQKMSFSSEALNLMGEMIRYADAARHATERSHPLSHVSPSSSSERRYIEFLDTFQTVFVQPLAAAEPDNAVLAKLARDLATVLLVSRQLLEEMEAEDARGRFAARAAEILDTWAPLLRSYKDYVTGAMRAKEEHIALQASSRRYQKALAATIEKNAARLLGQEFDSLLSMPVQRVPRLELLAANLLKATPLGAPTRAPLERAHATIQRTARHLNESFGRQDAREALAALQTRLAPLPAPLPPLVLVAPGRDLVLEADFGLSALDLGDCDAAALRDAGAAPRLDVLQVRGGRITGRLA